MRRPAATATATAPTTAPESPETTLGRREVSRVLLTERITRLEAAIIAAQQRGDEVSVRNARTQLERSRTDLAEVERQLVPLREQTGRRGPR